MVKQILWLVGWGFFFGGVASAEDAGRLAARECRRHVATALGEVKDALRAAEADVSDKKEAVLRKIGLDTRSLLYAMVVTDASACLADRRVIEGKRLDKQVGAGSAAAGSTSAVTKGSVPPVLGLAIERGALTRSDSGTTVTLRGKPLGVLQALVGYDLADSFYVDGRAAFLNRFSFAASFDTSRGDEAGTFTADEQQLSSYSVRVDLLNKRGRNFALGDAGKGQRFDQTLDAVATELQEDEAFKAWQEQTATLLAASARETIADMWANQLWALSFLDVDQTATDAFGTSLDRFTMSELANEGALLALDYTRRREQVGDVSVPSQHELTLIAEKPLRKGQGDLTFNGSFAFYDEAPAGVTSRLGDIRAGVQLDMSLGATSGKVPAVFSLAGRYERLVDRTAATNPRQNLFLAQAKLTLPMGDQVKVPLAVTWSNRSETGAEREIRANLGVSIDFDALSPANKR